jgi:hypothetical protein
MRKNGYPPLIENEHCAHLDLLRQNNGQNSSYIRVDETTNLAKFRKGLRAEIIHPVRVGSGSGQYSMGVNLSTTFLCSRPHIAGFRGW